MNLFNRKRNTAETNPYIGLRQQALSIQPNDIGITLDNNKQVYCAVIDMPIGTNVATLVCVFDGSVSLYYSNGGGLIGIGQKYEDVRHVGCSFLFSAG